MLLSWDLHLKIFLYIALFLVLFIFYNYLLQEMQQVCSKVSREPYLTPTTAMKTILLQMMLLQTSIGDWEHGGDFYAPSQDDFDGFFIPESDQT